MAESSRFKDSRWSLHGMTARLWWHSWNRMTHYLKSFLFLILESVLFSRNATVDEFAGLGARVQTCSRNEEELNKCLKEWEAKGFVVTGSVCDASCRVQIEKLIEEAGCVFNGKLNILASNPLLDDKVFLHKVVSRSPLQHVGDPKEVSFLVGFLRLPAAAAYITGQVISVDGGFTVNKF
ncbi:hypothetical protein SADUNF_Sadunf10G0153700 [Salix dunnii]|uniref:Tropinone reductase-like protein n=1 Tax=Salix dunnii TaxID=1413687 RepID=A0A835JSC5_9ROSI|nr:hypothetical protein SADUNF_Sadunf10G0153700 [Salix dunnii]